MRAKGTTVAAEASGYLHKKKASFNGLGAMHHVHTHVDTHVNTHINTHVSTHVSC